MNRTGFPSSFGPDDLVRGRPDRVALHLGAQGVARDTEHIGGPRLVAAGAFQDFLYQRGLDFGQEHLVQVLGSRLAHVLKVSAYGVLYVLS